MSFFKELNFLIAPIYTGIALERWILGYRLQLVEKFMW